jgi:hypothetical protein
VTDILSNDTQAEAAGESDSFDIRVDHVQVSLARNACKYMFSFQKSLTNGRMSYGPQAMLKAGEHLGCLGLVNLCKAKIGEFETRVRKAGIPFAEIVCALLYIARKVLGRWMPRIFLIGPDLSFIMRVNREFAPFGF